MTSFPITIEQIAAVAGKKSGDFTFLSLDDYHLITYLSNRKVGDDFVLQPGYPYQRKKSSSWLVGDVKQKRIDDLIVQMYFGYDVRFHCATFPIDEYDESVIKLSKFFRDYGEAANSISCKAHCVFLAEYIRCNSDNLFGSAIIE